MTTCGHPRRPAVARCVACGTTVCEECRRRYRSRNFCPDCWPPARRRKERKPSFRSPMLALLLSALPGLGHLYGRSLLKGLLFLAATGAGAALWPAAPLPVLGFLFLFCAWDARMTALRRNRRIAGTAAPPPAGEADLLLWIGTAALALLYFRFCVVKGAVVEPWIVWVAFAVVCGLSMLLGRGGQDVREA